MNRNQFLRSAANELNLILFSFAFKWCDGLNGFGFWSG